MKSVRDIRKLLREEGLTSEERHHVKAYLRTVMDENPVRDAVRARHTIKQHASGRFTLITRPVMASILIGVLAIGGGTVAAAENTLPGDTLYPVKVGFNEEFRALLALSPEAKATWSHQRAERRLLEAERLAAQGKLDENRTNKIEQYIERHAEHMESMANTIEAEGNTELAAEVRSDFEAALNAHGNIIIHLGINSHPPSQSHLGMILNRVGQQLQKTAVLREELETSYLESIPETITLEEHAKLKIANAQSSVNAAEKAISNSKNDTDTKDTAHRRLETAQSLLDAAEEALDSDDFSDAILKAHDANRIAHEAQIMILTADKIGVSIKVETDPEGNINVNVTPNEGTNLNTTIIEKIEDQIELKETMRDSFEATRERFENERDERERQFEQKRNRIHDQLKRFFGDDEEDTKAEIIIESEKFSEVEDTEDDDTDHEGEIEINTNSRVETTTSTEADTLH